MANFFQSLNQFIQSNLDKLGDQYTAQYATDIMAMASASITIYLLWRGYSTIAGKVATPIPDIIWDMAKFAIILMFISDAGGFLSSFNSAIHSIKEGLAGGDVWRKLDALWKVTLGLADKLFRADQSTVPLEGAIAAFLCWVGAVILMVVSAFIFIIADITITLLLLTAPIFIFCLMFGWLRQMFNNWLQLIFSSVLTVMFAGLIINLTMSFYIAVIGEIDRPLNLLGDGFLCLMVGMFGGGFVYLSKSYASQIASVGVEGAVAGMFTNMGSRGLSNAWQGVSSKGFRDFSSNRAKDIGKGLKYIWQKAKGKRE